MIIDFTEIPSKESTKTALSDSFELFARDFFLTLGYDIVEHPSRGADGKKDLIVRRSGEKYLVSCKHFAKSKRGVSDFDEINILERLEVHDCDGFIGFYSTIPNTTLSDMVVALKRRRPVEIFDRELIEFNIIGIPRCLNIFQRYFPKSFEKWRASYDYLEPLKLFKHYLQQHYKREWAVVKHIFHDEAIFWKTLRKTENLSEALALHGWQLLYDEKLDRISADEPIYFPKLFEDIAPGELRGKSYSELEQHKLGWGIIWSDLQGDNGSVIYTVASEAWYSVFHNFFIVNASSKGYFEKFFSYLRDIAD
jgi:hypothetical protein